MISFAVKRDFIFPSTVKFRLEMGLCQMSWSPFPCLTKMQPFSERIFLTFFSYSAIYTAKASVRSERKMTGMDSVLLMLFS